MSQQQTAMQRTDNSSTNALTRLRQFMEAQVGRLAEVIPTTIKSSLTPQRIVKVVVLAANKNPVLAECTHLSLIRSVMEIGAVGLEPGGPLGQAFLVPFRNNKTGKYEAQPIISYRGLIALARRSGHITSVEAHIVYAKDRFVLRLGTASGIEHEPFLGGPRGEAVSVYCVAHFKDGGYHTEFMTRYEVEKIRDKHSKARGGGPWQEHFEEMARKTVIRRAAKYWPLSIELAEAMEVQNTIEGQVFDVASEMEEEISPEGEVIEAPNRLTAIADKIDEQVAASAPGVVGNASA